MSYFLFCQCSMVVCAILHLLMVQWVSDRSFMVDPLSCFLFCQCSMVVCAILHLLMVRWVVGSILHGCPIELFLVLPMLPDDICYPVCGKMHIKGPLLLIGKSSPCSGGSRLPHSLSEWSSTICLMPYTRK